MLRDPSCKALARTLGEPNLAISYSTFLARRKGLMWAHSLGFYAPPRRGSLEMASDPMVSF